MMWDREEATSKVAKRATTVAESGVILGTNVTTLPL